MISLDTAEKLASLAASVLAVGALMMPPVRKFIVGLIGFSSAQKSDIVSIDYSPAVRLDAGTDWFCSLLTFRNKAEMGLFDFKAAALVPRGIKLTTGSAIQPDPVLGGNPDPLKVDINSLSHQVDLHVALAPAGKKSNGMIIGEGDEASQTLWLYLPRRTSSPTDCSIEISFLRANDHTTRQAMTITITLTH